jgi:hypothetical protein
MRSVCLTRPSRNRSMAVVPTVLGKFRVFMEPRCKLTIIQVNSTSGIFPRHLARLSITRNKSTAVVLDAGMDHYAVSLYVRLLPFGFVWNLLNLCHSWYYRAVRKMPSLRQLNWRNASIRLLGLRLRCVYRWTRVTAAGTVQSCDWLNQKLKNKKNTFLLVPPRPPRSTMASTKTKRSPPPKPKSWWVNWVKRLVIALVLGSVCFVLDNVKVRDFILFFQKPSPSHLMSGVHTGTVVCL